MVVLSISPYRGNHQRFFPFAGFLGLTPVVIQGNLKTVMEEDNKPLKASSVCVRVRCYEADLSNGVTKGKGMNVLFDSVQELWRKSEGEEWSSLGNFSKAFRIVIPVDATGVTTATFKSFRTWWQVEAVINHKPTALDGSRRLVSHQLPLTRFTPNSPSYVPSPAWISSPSSYSLAAERGLHYALASQSSVYGPSEPIDITFSFHKNDPSLQIRKIQICLDRHMTINSSNHGSGSELDDEDVVVPEDQPLFSPFQAPFADENYSFPKSPKPSPKGGLFTKRASLSKSPTTINVLPLASTPFDPSPSYSTLARHSPPTTATILGPKGTTTTSILIIESDEGALDTLGNGIDARVIGLVPKTKSLYRYSVGETMRTKFAHVHFTLSIKIFIKTKVGGNEVIELEPRPVKITSASEIDRNQARLDADRILAVADAELRLFDNSVTSLTTPPSTHICLDDEELPPSFIITESNGMRRAVSVDDEEVSSPPRHYHGSRRRSDQSEGVEAPLRSRARISPSQPGSPSELPHKILSTVYVSSTLPPSSLDFSAYSLHSTSISTPPLPQFADLCSPDSFSEFSNTLASLPNESSPRQSRRAGRSSTPYSSNGRPKSNRPGSISSNHSGASIASGGRYTRERSAPLLSTLPNVQPLSLYSSSTSSFSDKANGRPSTAPHSSIPPPFFKLSPHSNIHDELPYNQNNRRSFSRPSGGNNGSRKISVDGVKDSTGLWSFLKRGKA